MKKGNNAFSINKLFHKPIRLEKKKNLNCFMREKKNLAATILGIEPKYMKEEKKNEHR